MMISDKRINQIITEEINKSEVENIANRKISSYCDSREFKKIVREIISDTLEDFFRTLWSRSSSWKGGLKK